MWFLCAADQNYIHIHMEAACVLLRCFYILVAVAWRVTFPRANVPSCTSSRRKKFVMLFFGRYFVFYLLPQRYVLFRRFFLFRVCLLVFSFFFSKVFFFSQLVVFVVVVE